MGELDKTLPVAAGSTRQRRLPMTRWSLVLRAGGATSATSKAALADLCGLYWYPVYAFVRRSGKASHDAHDLTQGFFADLLQRQDLGTADPKRGRFRSWLLGCVKNYLANQHDFDTAQKRGGGVPLVSIDGEDAERRYGGEPEDGRTPEKLYFRRWISTLLERVLCEMREERVRGGTVNRFDLLRPYLVDEGEATYAQLAEVLGIETNAVKQAVHHLRLRFRDRLRAEISGTVESVDEIDDELRQLFAALA
jgi:DNA-directed RNA polymerase specialized sigma24 family protein